MVQLTINAEGDSNKAIIDTLQDIIKRIQNGSTGDFDESVSWWLENVGEDGGE